MSNQRGVIFQTVPEEVAQLIEHQAKRLQLPPEIVIRLGVTVINVLLGQHDPMIWGLVDAAKRDLERSIDRVLA